MNFLKTALGFDASKTSLRTETIAGATTFLTMSYILAVNPAILSTTGMDKGVLFTAMALAAAISTLLLAFMAKLPFAQAPSMGLNAFFAFTMCQAMHLSWQQHRHHIRGERVGHSRGRAHRCHFVCDWNAVCGIVAALTAVSADSGCRHEWRACDGGGAYD